MSGRIRTLWVWVISLATVSSSARAISEEVEEAWVARYDGPLTGASDRPAAAAVDAEGNVFVASRTGDDRGEVIKLSPQGDVGAFAQLDFDPRAIGLDAGGNVCVIGIGQAVETAPSDDFGDFLTVKLGADGEELWRRRLDWFEPSEEAPHGDLPGAIGLDGAGNVYVAGLTGYWNWGISILTVKYSPSGDEMWVAEEAAVEGLLSNLNFFDPVALAVEEAGSVVVASGAWVVKYDTDGGKQWSFGDTRWSFDLALDADRNIYVGSRNIFWCWPPGAPCPGGAVTKLSADGAFLWTVDRPALLALVVDVEGNLWVASGHPEIATAKYSPSGEELHVASYDGSAGDYDRRAVAMATDATGAVYVTVTGSSETEAGDTDYVTLKYAPDGTELWTRRYAGPDGRDDIPVALVLGPGPAVHVVGSSQGKETREDVLVATYDAEGNESWATRHDSRVPRADFAYDLAVDSAGNVLVTGTATAKYSPGGEPLWIVQHADGSESWGVEVDSQGNVYLVGGGIAKYSPDGTKLWETPAPEATVWFLMALATDGSVYVGGVAYDALDFEDYAVGKYDPDGSLAWTASYGRSGLPDYPSAVSLDGDGNVYVTGETTLSDSPPRSRATTLKYDAQGNRQWFKHYNVTPDSEGAYWTSAYALVLGQDRSVYVGGNGYGLADEAFLLKYDTDGDALWTETFICPGSYCTAQVSKLLRSSDGNVLIVGTQISQDPAEDYFFALKYSTSGAFLWEATYPEVGISGHYLRDAAVDGGGNLYLSGDYYSTESGYIHPEWDIATVKIDPEGGTVWARHYDGPAGKVDSGGALALDTDGNVYAAGDSQSERGDYDIVTIKYVTQPTAITFVRGDCNADGEADISDAVTALGALFLGEESPSCDDACDSNDDGELDISDAVAFLGVLFLGQGSIPEPGFDGVGCGVDPTGDEIGCERFDACP